MIALLFLILIYIFIVWIVTRMVVPHLGFFKESVPENIPEEFAKVIQDLHTQATDNYDFLKKSYEYVTGLYSGSRMRTITNFWVAFENPILHKAGFMPCTGQNFLLRVMLIKSGRFQNEDIKVKNVPLNLFIHQYLKVKVGNDWIDVDPWSDFLGMKLGQKSAIFG